VLWVLRLLLVLVLVLHVTKYLLRMTKSFNPYSRITKYIPAAVAAVGAAGSGVVAAVAAAAAAAAVLAADVAADDPAVEDCAAGGCFVAPECIHINQKES